MARYSDEQVQYHKARVRELLVVHPDASVWELKEFLGGSTEPIALDWKYVNKLKKKIQSEEAHWYNTKKISARIAQKEKKHRILEAELFKIALGDNKPTEIIQAAKEICELDDSLLRAQIAAGVFRDNAGNAVQGSAQVQFSFTSINDKTKRIIEEKYAAKQLTQSADNSLND